MARPLRVQYEGAVYHVMARGNRGSDVFNSDADRDLFYKTLSEAIERTGMLVHAYVLMDTHILCGAPHNM